MLDVLILCAAPVLAITLVYCLFKAYVDSANREALLKRDEENLAAYDIWRRRVQAIGGLEPVFCPLHLNGGERCFNYTNTAKLFIPRHPDTPAPELEEEAEDTGERPVFFDNEQGATVKTGWSLMDNFGGMRYKGHGKLYVTDKRLRFDGPARAPDIPLKDIHTVAASCSDLLIGVRDLDRPLLFNGVNGQCLRDTLHMLIRKQDGEGDGD